MTDSTDVGAAQIRVNVESADADQFSIRKDPEKKFTGPVENVRTAGPVGAKPVHESKALRRGFTSERFDIGRKRAQATDMNLIAHLQKPLTARHPRSNQGCGPS
jgi:hypothetical protein